MNTATETSTGAKDTITNHQNEPFTKYLFTFKIHDLTIVNYILPITKIKLTAQKFTKNEPSMQKNMQKSPGYKRPAKTSAFATQVGRENQIIDS